MNKTKTNSHPDGSESLTELIKLLHMEDKILLADKEIATVIKNTKN